MVITAGRPSGMAATARAIAVISMICQSRPRAIPTKKMKIAMPKMAMARNLPNFSIFCWKGVSSRDTFSNEVAILPISVFIPVAVTIALAWPFVIMVVQ